MSASKAELTYDEYHSALTHLSREVSAPLTDRSLLALDALYGIAELLKPHLGMYDVVAAEGLSSIGPALIYTHMIEKARAARRRSPPMMVVIDGEPLASDKPLPTPPTRSARTLMVAEYINYGTKARRAYQFLTAGQAQGSRPAQQVDVATVGCMDPHRPRWLHKSSQFFGLPQTSGIEHVLTHKDISTADCQRVASAFIAMLQIGT